MANDTNIREFDQNFGIPAGLKNAKYISLYDNPEDMAESDEVGDVASIKVIENEIDAGDEGDVDLPEPPETMTVVSQIIRTADDGTQVVDVVVEVNDTGVSTYDIRVFAS